MTIGYLLQAGVPDVRRPPFQGPANHVREVFTELRSRGHRVRLLAVLDGRIWLSSDLEHYEPVVVHHWDRGPLRAVERVVRRCQYELGLPYAALFESLRFAAACRQSLRDSDVLYERMGWVAYGGALAARRMQVPLVLEVNGDHLTEFEALGMAPRGMQRRLSLTLMRLAACSAAQVVATGEGWRARFIEQWQVAAEKVTTIENGTRLVELCTREQLRCFRPPADPSEPVTLVFVGGLEPWQGTDVLLRAFADARSSGAAVRLRVIGSGRRLDALRQLARELNVHDHIAFAGHLALTELAQELTNAEIGAAPYCDRAEFAGLKILDYKAAGLATIASGCDGHPALVTHGCNGWIVPPGDVQALAAAIVDLTGDAALRRRLGRQARIDAEERHGWQHTVQHLEETFLRLLASPPSRPVHT